MMMITADVLSSPPQSDAERTNTSNEVGAASIRLSMRMSLTALTLASYACGVRMTSPKQAMDS